MILINWKKFYEKDLRSILPEFFLLKKHTNQFSIMKNICLLLIILFCASCQNQEKATVKMDPIPVRQYDQKLTELGITLPAVSTPVANYVNIRQAGKILYLAGKGPRKADGTYIKGVLGADLTQEQGYEAARIVGINQLAVLKDHLGTLNRVKQILKVTGMVRATPDFGNQPEVINGFSDLMVEVFGEQGKHARAAVGMGSLPRGIAVEIDMIVEIY